MWSRPRQSARYPQQPVQPTQQPQQPQQPQWQPPRRIGMTGGHKDMSGNYIDPSQRIGIKQPGQNWLRQRTIAAPQGSTLLKSRQSLFSEMQKAGAGGLTQDMRNRAASMGVTQSGWERAAKKIPAVPLPLPQEP